MKDAEAPETMGMRLNPGSSAYTEAAYSAGFAGKTKLEGKLLRRNTL